MKIIGRSEEGYIIDASRDEIANLIGFYGAYGRDYDNCHIGIGSEINVHNMYQQLYELSRAHNNLERSKEYLKKCISLLDFVDPVTDVSIERE